MSVDFAVVGRGLWGTAAAMYLAQAGHRVALIGPSEPEDPQTHNAPFASHHDAGRITRCIARDVMWARASARSIARYEALAQNSGIGFYTPCGGMMASDEPAYADAIADVAEAEGLTHDRLTDRALADRFPEFRFAQATRAFWDPTGGVIDPRAMRRAHEVLALRAGAQVVDGHATGLNGGTIELADGATLSAGHVVLANGSYAALSDLLPQRPQMIVCARTVFFAEVSEVEAQRLSQMPSLIWRPQGQDHYLYLLPPIRYPDGRLLIKIGGEPDDLTVSGVNDTRDWMRGEGNASIAANLEAALRSLMPDLHVLAKHQAACILAHSATGFPYIGRLSEQLTLATACGGAGAKCADELGRIAAQVAMGQISAAAELDADLTPRLA